MRRAIFKDEVHYFFHIHNLNDAEKNDILKALFNNPLSPSKQYLLNKNVESVDHIENLVKSVVQNEKFLSDFKTSFLVNDDLELPNRLREQLRRKEKIAIIAGAGLSKLLGLPLWEELANKATDFLQSNNLINFDEAEKIKKETISPKQKLSMFYNILPEELEYSFYDECFTPKSEMLKKDPYKLLCSLPFPKISLNLDSAFLDALTWINSKHSENQEYDRTKKINIEHIFYDFSSKIELNPSNALYQIHGYYKYLNKHRIVTMTDYLEHYYEKRQDGVKAFLTKVFNEYSIIFVGVGLEEFELLQYLLGGGRRHHTLVSTYMNDTNLINIKKEYFNKIGINAYGYYLDFIGYQRLYDVLDSWVNEIHRELNGEFYEKTGEFDDIEL